jgi:SNF2 family DNA or RNA helicase
MKPEFHEPILITMNKYEQLVYDAIEKKIKNYAIDDYLQNIDFVNRLKRGRMMRLRQCVSYLSLLNSVIENYDEDVLSPGKDLRYIVTEYDKLELPAKFEYLASMLRVLMESNQKVVIWTNFIGTIEKLKKYISNVIGKRCELIYGQTPIEQTSIINERTREQIRDEFVESNSGLDILIANPAACGESISLHKTCHHAIYFDLTYNCAQYLQSLDRIHRVGGSENITANYYFLQYRNTIDQDILNSVRRKEERMKRIIDNDYKIYELDMFNDDGDELKAYNRLFNKS